MHIRCPFCNEVFDVSDAREAAPVKCRGCGKIFASKGALRAKPRAPRIPAPLPCRVDGERARMIDVSRTGILVQAATLVAEPGQVVQVRLDLPGGIEPLVIDAEVIRRDDSRWALKIRQVRDPRRFDRFLRVRSEAARIFARLKG